MFHLGFLEAEQRIYYFLCQQKESLFHQQLEQVELKKHK